MLIKSTQDLIKYVPRLSANYPFAGIMPFIILAEKKHVIPFIGQEFYEELNEAYVGTPSDKELAAINQLQFPIAYYTMLEALPHIGIQIGSSGYGDGNSQTTNPTPQWKEFKIESNYCSNAESFLDDALAFLEKNRSDYPTWLTSEAYTISKELFISDSKELNSKLPVFQSRRAYLSLRAFIAEVQEETVKSALGGDLYEDLLNKHVHNSLNPEEKQIIKLIQKPLAHIAARKAFNQLAIEFNGRGFRILSSSDNITQKTAVSPEKLQPLLADFANSGEIGMIELKKHLQNNADVFPLYKDSSAYISQNVIKPWEFPDNSCSKSFMT